MKAKGPKSERETVIRLDEVGDHASVWTASQPVYNRLKRLGHTPFLDGEREARFLLPKRCVSFRRERQRKEKPESKRTLHKE